MFLVETLVTIFGRHCFGNHVSRLFLQVANFGNTEDDATFWSRLIPPEAAIQAEV